MMKEHIINKLELSLAKTVKYFIHDASNNLFNKKQNKDLACFFKLPMFFIENSQIELAKKTLDFIHENFIMKDGDFRTDEQLKSIKPEYIYYWSYFNGWILRSANLLNYELPKSTFQYFQSFHDGKGHFISQNPEEITERTTDVLTIAHHGLFYLESGNNDWATEAADFLCETYDNQKSLEEKFFLRFDRNRDAIVVYPTEQQMFFSVERGKEQLYFMLAYPCAFLGLMYQKTQNKNYLNYAIKYMDFLLTCDDNFYLSQFSHKTAWAASILYAETNDDKYLNIINRIIDYFISIQSEEGLWFKNEDSNIYLDQSAEIGCWFSQILKNINNFELVEKQSQKKCSFFPHKVNPPVNLNNNDEEDKFSDSNTFG